MRTSNDRSDSKSYLLSISRAHSDNELQADLPSTRLVLTNSTIRAEQQHDMCGVI